MNPPRRSPLFTVLLGSLIGCAQTPRQRDSATVEPAVLSKANRAPVQSHNAQRMETALEPTADAPELQGPQPMDVFIRRALAENRTVQAAYHNVQALAERIPQVTTLDDPVASNAVFPIPGVAPQYFLMGYNPYNLTLAQQFPWLGTLRLRGEAAQRDVQIALAELAAAELDTVAAVKRAYYSLHASSKGRRDSEGES